MNWEIFWGRPEYAWLLLLVLPLSLLQWRARRLRSRDGRRLSGGLPATRFHCGRDLLQVLIFALLVAGLCRPQWGLEALPREGRGLDILVALDVSRSMLADDQAPNRLAAAKRALRGLLARLQGERIGLIAFAGSAFQVCPLTVDYATFAQVLAETDSSSIPLAGTSLSAAMVEASRDFLGGDTRRALIVVSDGEDQGGDPAPLPAALRGVSIYAVAVGSSAGGLIPLPGGRFFKDQQGGIVHSRMQAAPLRHLATDGRVFELNREPLALEHLYAAEWSAGARIQTARQGGKERYQVPLGLALLLLLFDLYLARWAGS